MDLFIVNRYSGDIPQGNTEVDEKTKLAKFLKKVEERKKKKAQKCNENNTNEDDVQNIETESADQINGYLSPDKLPPKKKKKKNQVNILENSNEEKEMLSIGPSTKKHKCSMKDLENSITESEDPANTDLLILGSSPKKKKKEKSVSEIEIIVDKNSEQKNDDVEMDSTIIGSSPKKKKKKSPAKTELEDALILDKHFQQKYEAAEGLSEQEPECRRHKENLEIFAENIKLDADANTEQLLNKKQKKRRSKTELQLEETLNHINRSAEDLEVSSNSPKKQKKKRHKENVYSEDSETDDRKKQEGNNKYALPTSVEGFTIIGNSQFDKKQKVKRVLPHWLAKPSVVAVNLQQLTTTIKGIPELDYQLVRILKRNKITHFFPVQAQVIPYLLAAQRMPPHYWPSDVCVSAPTGSGKTLAFVLPIVQALQSRLVPQIRALVMLPVQDLAVQVYKVFCTYSEHTDLHVILLTGQNSFQQEQQQLVTKDTTSEWRSLVDILVTTPGRLVDHLHYTSGFSLQHLRFLVMDEADRIIDNVQNDWLFHLESRTSAAKYVGHAPPLNIATLEEGTAPPQKLLFSATLTQDPEKLQQLGLFQPKLFTSVVGAECNDYSDAAEVRGEFVGKYTTPAELTEQMCIVTPESKPLVLYHLVSSNSWKQVLVFVGSQKDAHRLSLLLSHLSQGHIKVSEISSALARHTREKILTKFASGEIQMLVSSDALARGMDIPGVNYVVLYNMPKSVKNYIHRVGRTGRAGKCGTAITLLQPSQVNQFKEMISNVGKEDLIQNVEVDETELENLEELYKSALDKLRQDLERETVQQHRKEKISKKQASGVLKLKKKKRQLKNGAINR